MMGSSWGADFLLDSGDTEDDKEVERRKEGKKKE
jgi:hypothetical protein